MKTALHSFFFWVYLFALSPRFPSVISPRVFEDGRVDLMNTLNTAGKLVIYQWIETFLLSNFNLGVKKLYILLLKECFCFHRRVFCLSIQTEIYTANLLFQPNTRRQTFERVAMKEEVNDRAKPSLSFPSRSTIDFHVCASQLSNNPLREPVSGIM